MANVHTGNFSWVRGHDPLFQIAAFFLTHKHFTPLVARTASRTESLPYETTLQPSPFLSVPAGTNGRWSARGKRTMDGRCVHRFESLGLEHLPGPGSWEQIQINTLLGHTAHAMHAKLLRLLGGAASSAPQACVFASKRWSYPVASPATNKRYHLPPLTRKVHPGRPIPSRIPADGGAILGERDAASVLAGSRTVVHAVLQGGDASRSPPRVLGRASSAARALGPCLGSHGTAAAARECAAMNGTQHSLPWQWHPHTRRSSIPT